ncbi:MAG: hypothetical protein J7L79_00750 [Thaumarchaeota archaeon]|nr:hypothetical protein [Nitrososphaerota archaeon]
MARSFRLELGWRTLLKAVNLVEGIELLPRARSWSLSLLLVLEIAFAGLYLALTRNLLVIYLTSIDSM